MRHDRIATIIIIILALTSLVGAQTTWYVDDGTCGVGTPGDPFCSIQTAINTAASGDTILVAAGTYFERIDFMGKDLEIIGDGPGLSTINASGQGNSAVRATTGETSAALLQGFTITGGTGAPDFGSAHGGGLFFMNGGSPRVTNCVVSGNSCNQGGGAFLFAGSTFTDVVFMNNSTDDRGGGVYMGSGNIEFIGCTFSGNSTVFGTGGGVHHPNGFARYEGCSFNNNTCGSRGGGLYLESTSSSEVIDCTFNNNVAQNGGGIHVQGDNHLIDGCNFVNNTASANPGDGGGVKLNGSDAPISNSTFSSNFGQQGGGLYTTGSVAEISDCTFINNDSFTGGGVYNNGGLPVYTRCLFQSNTTNYGGGMYNNISSCTINECRFLNHSIVRGGALYNNQSSPRCTNSVFANNSVLDFGGAMYNFGFSDVKITNCTFRGNSAATEGGGLYNFNNSDCTITNTIMWNNSPEQILDSFSTANVSYSLIHGGWTGTGNISANPNFVNEGSGDYRLAPGSPCIDAGDSMTTWLSGVDVDLDGLARFADDPATTDTGVPDADGVVVDMGAYEVQDPCSFDLDGDGVVNTTDLLILLASWGSCPGCPADINNDGEVNTADLLGLLAGWGPC